MAIIQGPCGSALQVDGDFDEDLVVLEGDRHVEEILASISTTVLEGMSADFLPFRKSWARDGSTWLMHLQGREGRPQTDYLLGMEFPLFQDVSVWYPRNNSNHYMVLGCFLSAAHQENHRYIWNLRRSPLHPPSTQIQKDPCFADLRWNIPKPTPRERQGNTWISAETWRLVGTRVEA